MRLVIFLSLFALAFCSAIVPAGADSTPQHPRLLIGPDDVAALRRKVRREPFSHMLASIIRKAETPAEPDRRSVLYDMRIRSMAQAYLLTGKQKYADNARDLALKMVADKPFWNNPSSKGLTRSAGALSVAIAYDLCYDAWDAATRKTISAELLKITRSVLASMGAGANNNIANNWQGVRYASAGLAALACDEPAGKQLARDSYSSLLRHLKANLGSGSWNPEGIGYTTYPATFTGPFGVAAERAGIGDLRKDVPGYARSYWTLLAGTSRIRHMDGFGLRADLADDHPHYNPHGTAGMSFWYLPDSYDPAVKWMYDHFVGAQGNKSYDEDSWGGGFYSVLFYPEKLEAVNPARAVGLNFVDKSHGVAIFRNEFDDDDDVIALVNAASRRPAGAHAGPDTNTFRLQGLGSLWVVGSGRTSDPGGQSNLFAGPVPRRGNNRLGELVDVRFDASGGGFARLAGSCFGVRRHVRLFAADFDEAAGAAALVVNSETSLNGRLWRLNTPEFNEISINGNSFTLKSPVGSSLKVTVIEPAEVQFRTGRFARGGAAMYKPLRYRGKGYTHNNWIEFDCDGRVMVVMTLQQGHAPTVEVRRGPHGAIATINKKRAVVYEKQSGRFEIVDAPARSDIPSRKIPLGVRGAKALTRSDSTIQLNWLVEEIQAEKILIERRIGQGDWQQVASVAPEAGKWTDSQLTPATKASYRLVAVNSHGRAQPSEVVTETTWQAGYSLNIEDFAGDAKNSFGPWKAINQNRGFQHVDRAGSARNAESPDGFWATGSVKIRNSNALINETIRCDLSGRSAAVEFDVRCQAVTVIGLMLKLADGQWVIYEANHVHNAEHAWKTLHFDLRRDGDWLRINPRTLAKGPAVQVTDEDLAGVQGIGICADWVINQKYLYLDQLHLYARKFRLAGSR